MSTSVPFPDEAKLAIDQQRHDHHTQLQASLIELAYDAIIVRDPESRIVSWNRGAERLYGWTAAEAVGRSIGLVFPPEEPVAAACLISAQARSAGVLEYEAVRLCKDGTRRTVSVTTRTAGNVA